MEPTHSHNVRHAHGAALTPTRPRGRQVQELRVALGWQERFALAGECSVLDMGLHHPKCALPRAFTVARHGPDNAEAALPTRPVQYPHEASIFLAYTQSLHLRCVYFDLMKDGPPRPAAFFTAPGALEAMLGRSAAFTTSVRIAGEWLWAALGSNLASGGTGASASTNSNAPRAGILGGSGGMRTGFGSAGKGSMGSAGSMGTGGGRDGTDAKRRRFFHVRCSGAACLRCSSLSTGLAGATVCAACPAMVNVNSVV